MIAQKILLDTNVLLIPAQFKIDIFEGIKDAIVKKHSLYVLEKSCIELENIIEGKIRRRKGADKAAASLAKQLIKAKKVKILKSTDDKKTDDSILDWAAKGYIVATQDKELIKRLKLQQSKVLQMRQKEYFILK